MAAPAEGRGTGAIAVVVLAAGRSSRMGAHKLLLPLGSRPVVAHAVDAAERSSAEFVVVVLGHEVEQVRAALPIGRAHTVVNGAYTEGMASSLRVGLAAAEAEASAPLAGILVTLGDQPLVSAAHLDALLAAARAEPDALFAATYGGVRGTPTYLPSVTFDEVRALTGDEGGRSILRRHLGWLRPVALTPPQVGLDCDTPEDYQRIQQAWARLQAGAS